ncbi:hypothetical protein [Mycolicibacterium gadium]|uniref:hypothetical protein n=1 Tax=Mycolicibacterium gadium TaxID=1794 RepID=UPI002FDCEDC4
MRFFRIHDLIAAGYLAYAAPLPTNPDHAHIRAPIFDEDIELHQAWWEREERVTLQELARD